MRHEPGAGFPGAPCFPACALSNLSAGLTAQRVFLQDLQLKIMLWSRSMERWAPVEDFSSACTNQYGVLYEDAFSSLVCFCGHNRPHHSRYWEHIIKHFSFSYFVARWIQHKTQLSLQKLRQIFIWCECAKALVVLIPVVSWGTHGHAWSFLSGVACAVVSTVREISLTTEGEWLIFRHRAIPETDLLVSCLDA